jgi:uncharacterized membrane protein
MNKGRLEAFRDGVLAIIITIMVLEMRVPVGDEPAALRPLLPVFLSYALGFLQIAMLWGNHHHLFQATERVNGWILWANINLLFWLSLLPFATGWMGENNFAPWPLALYGSVLLAAGIAYSLLAKALVSHHGPESTLSLAIGNRRKGLVSLTTLRRCDPDGLCSSLDRVRHLRRGRAALGRARVTHRRTRGAAGR